MSEGRFAVGESDDDILDAVKRGMVRHHENLLKILGANMAALTDRQLASCFSLLMRIGIKQMIEDSPYQVRTMLTDISATVLAAELGLREQKRQQHSKKQQVEPE